MVRVDANAEENSPADALRCAVDRLGSQVAMGRLCGVTQQSVSKWIDLGKALPAEHVLAVEQATGISRHQLRPDLYPDEGAGPADGDDGSLFARFGGVKAMADALDQPIGEVLRWRQDRRVPSEQQPAILRRARDLGFEILAEDVIFPFPEDRQAL